MPNRRSTSHDVAKLAGVSRTTVSFVLNNVPGVSISEATRQRVLAAAKSLDYLPDATGRKLVSGKSYMLGFVLLQSPEQVFNDALLMQVMLGVEQAAIEQGFHVLLKPIEPGNQAGYTELVRANHADGIIVSGPRQDDQEILHLHQDRVPLMLMGQLPDTDIPYVDIDAVEGAASAVRHLIALGHARIAMITNAPLQYTSAQHRRRGYMNAMQAAGIEYKEELVREGDYTPKSGFEAMMELLNLDPRPSAVFIASDIVAMGAMQAIKASGLTIPEDISIAGFDDIPLAGYFDPPLTSVRLPAYGLGWAAGERLVRLIQGEIIDETGVLLESELIIRRSTAGNAD